MTRKKIIIIIMISLLVLTYVIQEDKVMSLPVVHQHEVAQQEDKNKTGFSFDGNLTSHLPIIIIHSDGGKIPGEEMQTEERLYCGFSVINHQDQMNSTKDKPSMSGNVEIGIQGNSSRYFDKKQYAIKCVDDNRKPKDSSLLGMPAESSWVLNGSEIDHSQIRNYMLYNISGEIMHYAPRCRMCEVFLTDAEGKLVYQGLYTLIEKVKVGQNRIDLKPYDPTYAESSFLLLMNGQIDNIKVEHLKTDGVHPYSMDLKYLGVDEVSYQTVQYVKERGRWMDQYFEKQKL